MERFVDGRAEARELMEARESTAEAIQEWSQSAVTEKELWKTLRVYRGVLSTVFEVDACSAATRAIDQAWRAEAIDRFIESGTDQPGKEKFRRLALELMSLHLPLIHEIIGNPFRSVPLDPIWLTPTVSNLAQAAYEESLLPSGELDSERLAILGDALEDAGCAEPTILGHLRDPGPHVRGCFVLDLLLGKS
jgi:hypothetical protein